MRNKCINIKRGYHNIKSTGNIIKPERIKIKPECTKIKYERDNIKPECTKIKYERDNIPPVVLSVVLKQLEPSPEALILCCRAGGKALK